MKQKIEDLFNNELVVINVGIELFGNAIANQNTQVTQVQWKPPAGGDQEMIDILKDLGGV